MPSESGKQHRYFEFIKHNPSERPSSLSAKQVDEWTKADTGSPWKHRESGGGIIARQMGGSAMASSGSTSSPAMMAGIMGQSMVPGSPTYQAMYQQYSQLPAEKLQELASRYGGGTPQGQMIQKALQSKQMGTAPAGATQPQAPPPQQQAQARGGIIPHRDAGGPLGVSLSMASPWWERSEERDSDSSFNGGGGGGYLHGTTMGRGDHVTTSSPGGSYIVPADVVSGLGEGNSLAGARVMDRMLSTGPHGIPMPRMGHGRGVPPPPRPGRLPQQGDNFRAGGVPDKGERVPVKLSHGEYEIAPHHVRIIGKGDIHRGHKVLDKWVVLERKKIAKKMLSLPGPVKEAA